MLYTVCAGSSIRPYREPGCATSHCTMFFFKFNFNNILESTRCWRTWVLLQVSVTTLSFP